MPNLHVLDLTDANIVASNYEYYSGQTQTYANVLPAYMFCGQSKLKEIKWPSSITSIGGYAFCDCSGLTSVDLSNSSIQSIGDDAFGGCFGITSVDLSNSSIQSIGNSAFWSCSGITSVDLSNSSIQSIGNHAFSLCYGLTSVNLTGCNKLTSIGSSAFSNCNRLTSIEIPNSVTSIGNSAFSGCSGLTAVKVDRETPISITSDVFTNRANATLFVPAGSTAAYEAADYWNEFKEIVEYAAITMGSSGIATYSSNYDLDFTSVSGLKAYTAGGFSPSAGETTMMRVFKVPAGEGLLLKGEPGSYDVPSVSVDNIYANLLVGVPTATIVNPTEGEYTNFILTYDEVDGIGFYPMDSTGEIGPNKAYLQLPTSALPAASRRIILIFDDEEDVTGIKSLNDKGTLDPWSLATEGTQEMINDKAVYDLQGRRVANPTRGLYIKGGKKFIKK
jgi:Leucine-rich repeat (LRR) protein